jgi:hypothetical protein
MRSAAAFLVLGGGLAFAQSSMLPATRPTSDSLPTAVSASALTKTERAAHRAEVVFAANQLTITANNSSLNQILREISKQSGMKITGGVTDERVYGQYGPGPAADVLASLLEGTGSNMLFSETSSVGPSELILTTRTGGPTPPNPNAPGFDDEIEVEDRPVQPQQSAVAPSPSSTPSKPAAAAVNAELPVILPTGAPGPIRDAPTVAPATDPGTTPGPNFQSNGPNDPTSPNGVKTPQQIYQELQQLRQQQQAPSN